jgi:hypothetical protein
MIMMMQLRAHNKRHPKEIKKKLLTSGTVTSYGVFTKTGGLSFTSDTRTIIGMFRLRRVDTTVQDICNLNNNNIMQFTMRMEKKVAR